jgi:flagellar biosynthesis protein FlhF
MIIKKYLVDELREAMPLIKRDLGQDAVILNTKKIKVKKFLGIIKEQKLEVVAAIDPKNELKLDPPNKKTPEASKPLEQTATKESTERDQKNRLLDNELLSEIQHIKSFMIHAMDNGKLPEQLVLLNDLMTKQGISNDVKAHFMSRMMLKISQNPNCNKKDVLMWAREEMQYDLEAFHSEKIEHPKRMICFVGPTGVGKTTTIAKLAGELILQQGKKVGFITADTYRIAAVEQLQMYAEILGAPLEVAATSEELQSALEKLSHCDFILMDTAGRNYTQQEYILELEELLQSKVDIQKNLVLSLTSKYDDMIEIIEQFQSLPIDEIILTKKDETSSYGTVINLMYKYSTAIRYITTGQNVPDDIERLSPKTVLKYIFGEDAND